MGIFNFLFFKYFSEGNILFFKCSTFFLHFLNLLFKKQKNILKEKKVKKDCDLIFIFGYPVYKIRKIKFPKEIFFKK